MDTTPPQGTMARHRKPSFCQKQHLRQLGRRVYGARLTLNPQVFAIHLLDAMLHLVLSMANKSPCTLRSRRLAGLPGPRPPHLPPLERELSYSSARSRDTPPSAPLGPFPRFSRSCVHEHPHTRPRPRPLAQRSLEPTQATSRVILTIPVQIPADGWFARPDFKIRGRGTVIRQEGGSSDGARNRNPSGETAQEGPADTRPNRRGRATG